MEKARETSVVVLVILLLGSAGLPAAAKPAGGATPWPGSVEHVGMTNNSGPFYFGRQSLVKTFVMRRHVGELPGPTTGYREPEVLYIMAGRRTRRTGKTLRTVSTLLMKPGGAPVAWKVGKLAVGTYVLRIIGAIPTKDMGRPPKQLVFQMRINDRRDGSLGTYVLRGRGVDTFYCLQEFAFQAADDRELGLEVSLLDDSETSAYVYNFEIHDVLAECAKKAGKKAPSLYTLEERERARAVFAQTEAGKKTLAEVRRARKLAPAARRRRDENIWNSLPPINCMVRENYIPVIGRRAAIPIDYLFDRAGGRKCWLLHRIYGGVYGSDWDRPYAAVHDEWKRVARHAANANEIYTRAHLLAHEPLGDTGDRGWGVIRDGKLLAPIARLNTTSLLNAHRYLSAKGMDRYHLAGDEVFARDMAFLLARYAWWLPTYMLRHCSGYSVFEADIPWMQTRYYQSKFMNHHYALAYDRLFPFIQGNEELARALGRFIPWIKTPEDVIRLLDTHLVQYVAKNMLHYRYYYDNTSADMMLQLAAIQGDAKISEPWMEFLWSRVYYYPIGRQPLPDVVSLNSQRDGTSPIGSTFYATQPATTIARLIEPYMRAGGLEKYDLRDFQRYPEAIAGCYWPVESPVAGQWVLGIGDVGGPSLAYGKHTNPTRHAASGWRWTRDPVFAWLLANRAGRTTESDGEWVEIEAAAEGVADPIMGARSRVLSAWSGILESGVGDPDFRFHRAAAVRVGRGYGHAHNDALDLRVWAHGLIMSGDFGQRGSYGKPTHADTRCHNLVLIDEDQQRGHSWVRNLADMIGVQYLQAEAVPAKGGMLRRQVALVDVDEGRPSQQPKPWLDPDVTTPNSYVFDVFRAVGGSVHTHCFHGNVDDMHFEVNVKNRKVLPRDKTPERARLEESDPEAKFLRDFRWTRPEYMGKEFLPDNADWVADAPDGVLQATWRLAVPAEQRMAKGGGAPTEARKFTRLHLFDVAGQRVLHGIVIDKNDGARHNPEFRHYAGRCVFTRRRGSNLQSVYVSLIEPYAGEPFIVGRRTLAVEPNETDALRAVAVEVKTAGGRTDVLFADGRPQKQRRLGKTGIEVRGEFACVARDAQGTVNLSLSRGALLKAGGFSISPAAASYQAKVTAIDYRKRELTLDRQLPVEVLRGAFIEIGDKRRRTSYEIAEARTEGGRSIIRMRKSLEMARSRVRGVRPQGARTLLETGIRGFAEAVPGLWVANGDYSKTWRLEDLRNGPIFSGSASIGDFKAESGAVLFLEVGKGAEITLPTRVSLRRASVKGVTVFEVVANISFTVEGAPGLEMSTDGVNWRATQLVPANAGRTPLYLRGLR